MSRPAIRPLRTLGAAAALLLCATMAASAERPAADVQRLELLDFLTGAWGTDGATVEYWLPPLRGLMVGVNRSTEGEGMPFFEYLRIEARPDGIYYVASPRGTGTTAFKLTELSISSAVFENPEHDFPQKITYRRVEDRLEAEVGGERDGQWGSFTLSWERQP